MLDHQQVLIPWARVGQSQGTQHRILAWRDDNLGSQSMRLNGGVNQCLIVETVTDKTCNAPCDLGEQRRLLRWVLLIAFRHRRGEDLPLPIHSNGQLFPTFLLLLAVLLGILFALTTHLSPRTVDDHVNRALCFPTDAPPAFKRGIAPGKCRMIGTRKSHAHQLHDGAQQPFGVAKRQAKQPSEREGGLDRDISINRLGAALAGLRRRPGVNGVLTDPQGDVVTITERLLILAPVCHAVRGCVFRMSLGSFVGLRHAQHRWLLGVVMAQA